MKDKILDYVKEIDWWKWLHTSVVTIFTSYINLFLLYRQLPFKTSSINTSFSGLIIGGYIISVLGLIAYLTYVINKRFIIRFASGYIVYILVSYILLASSNINNKKFHFWNLFGNGFVQTNSLVTLLSIILLSLGIRWLTSRRENSLFSRLDFSLESIFFENVLMSLLLGITISNNKQLLTYINEGVKSLVTLGDKGLYKVLFLDSWFYLILFSVISAIVLNGMSALKNNKTNISLVVTTSFSLALIFNYALQYGVKGDTDLLGYYLFPGALLYQILVLALFSLLLYVVTNRYIATTLFLLILGTLVSVANIMKDQMRSEPLLITDFIWLKEIDLLLSFLNIWMIGAVILVFILPIIAYLLLRRKGFVKSIFDKKWPRLTIAIGIILVFAADYSAFKYDRIFNFKQIPIVTKLKNTANIEWMGFDKNSKYKSVMYVWTKQLTTSVMKEPKGYSNKAIDSIVQKYQQIAKEINLNRKNNISDRTVIYILSESLSNPNRVPGVNLSTNVLTNIDQIKASTTSGLMTSNGFGGGTANMEFQSLTGLPYANFSTAISTIYTEVVPKMSVFPTLSNSYKSTNRIVIHPSGANNYNRKIIYKQLGFDTMIFASDSDKTFKNPKFTGLSISDKTVYDTVLSNLSKKDSQFFSVITMQNHTPWSVGKPKEVIASGANFTASENGQLTEYSRLLTYTDKSTKEFLKKLKDVKKDITVVFYGDHLPGLYPESAFSSKPNSQYQTDYFIWSNHDNTRLNYPLVGSSDFAAELLEHTDSKVSPYYALLTKILKSKNNAQDDAEYREASRDLKMVQYDITDGKYYLANQNFFNIK